MHRAFQGLGRSMFRKFTTLVCLAAAAVFAQSNQGTITGTISDPAGAVVPTAQIEARNSETGVVYRGGTSGTGNYVLAMPSGTYEITVTAAGFKKFVQQNVQVISATDTRKDVILEIGAANEQVTVTETASLLKSTSTLGTWTFVQDGYRFQWTCPLRSPFIWMSAFYCSAWLSRCLAYFCSG